jgi:hypothetical protein
MRSRLLLDVVIGQCTTVLKLFAGENKLLEKETMDRGDNRQERKGKGDEWQTKRSVKERKDRGDEG